MQVCSGGKRTLDGAYKCPDLARELECDEDEATFEDQALCAITSLR